MRCLRWILFVVLLSPLAGCGPSDEEQRDQAQAEARVQKEREEADRLRRERRAMMDAVAYDRAVGDQVAGTRTLGEIVFGAKDETVANNVRNLKRVPLDDCPQDFQDAYRAHIAAWESRNHQQIQATWTDVIAIARLHGVTISE